VLVGVSSSLLAASGSVYYDVDVPDFTNGTLAVSGLAIGATPGTPSGPKDRLASLVPVVPTTQRDFSAEQEVTAFLRVHQPGRHPLVSVGVRARVLDARSAAVFTREERLEPQRFGIGRTADYTLQLPLADLPKGEYLLTVGDGERKRRESRGRRVDPPKRALLGAVRLGDVALALAG
jgi:hypothetical protein